MSFRLHQSQCITWWHISFPLYLIGSYHFLFYGCNMWEIPLPPCHAISPYDTHSHKHIHAHGSASAGAILPLTMTTHPITNNRVTNQKIFTLMHTTFAGKRDTYARNTHTHTQRSDLMHFVLRGICLHMEWMVKQWTRH